MSYERSVENPIVEFCNGMKMNKNDIMYWRNVLQVSRNNADAMYYVALDTEKDAMTALSTYRENKDNMYLGLFKTRIIKAVNLLNEAIKKGHKPSEAELKRIKSVISQIDITEFEKKKSKKKKFVSLGSTIALLVLAFFLGLVISAVWFVFTNDNSTVNAIEKAKLLPYTVSYEEADDLRTDKTYSIKLIQVNKDMDEKELERQLVSTVKTMYALQPNVPILVYASYIEGGMMKEVGAAVYRINGEMEVYIYK